MAERRQTDVLVIGGGAAGLSAALPLAQFAQVTVICKGGVEGGSSVEGRRCVAQEGTHPLLGPDGVALVALLIVGLYPNSLLNFLNSDEEGTSTPVTQSDNG